MVELSLTRSGVIEQKRRFLFLFVGFLFTTIFLVFPSSARVVRVATFNVENGVGTYGSEKYRSIRDILRRVDADIVAFQELTAGTSNAWARMSEELGYPHRIAATLGAFSGDTYVGFFSLYPILDAREVRSPPGAVEIARWPLRIIVKIPGAARPLVCWTVHHKAQFGYADSFRRAVEACRIIQDIGQHLQLHTNHIEYIVLGDLNDDFMRADQPLMFMSPPHRLPSGYRLGSDIKFPLHYRTFPHDHYGKAGLGMRWVPAYRADSSNRVTHVYTEFTLDYIYVSLPIWNHPDGAPRGEVYHSTADKPAAGLRKKGPPLPPETSAAASDHSLVFADLNVEDEPKD